jgi:hypothetical protein
VEVAAVGNGIERIHLQNCLRLLGNIRELRTPSAYSLPRVSRSNDARYQPRPARCNRQQRFHIDSAFHVFDRHGGALRRGRGCLERRGSRRKRQIVTAVRKTSIRMKTSCLKMCDARMRSQGYERISGGRNRITVVTWAASLPHLFRTAARDRRGDLLFEAVQIRNGWHLGR